MGIFYFGGVIIKWSTHFAGVDILLRISWQATVTIRKTQPPLHKEQDSCKKQTTEAGALSPEQIFSRKLCVLFFISYLAILF
jgi:hypothetical protein